MVARPEVSKPCLAASVFALALCLGACGGSDDSSSTATTVTPTPSPTPTATPTPTPTATGTAYSTASVDCPYSGTYTGTYSTSGTLSASWNWSCSGTTRSMTGTGLPDHAVGTFPNSNNPNAIASQSISASMTTAPTLTTTATSVNYAGYMRNSVKIEAATNATCPSSATGISQCSADGGGYAWKVEALGQSVFSLGLDSNNAHVQPGGVYHYHGVPEGLLTNAGVSDSNRKMLLVGWALDGFPIYARYCYTTATDASSVVKKCASSYVLDTTADTDRPSTSWFPLGTFTSDYSYVAGSGDLDECNGRTGVTPEFPDGIYYYVVTDEFPFMGRCVKGSTS